MSKQNGGIIGPDNVPTGAFGAASGVWKLSDVTDYKRQGTWPVPLSGHQVANSCRFNSGSSDNLARTPSSASNKRTFTMSFWLKRTNLTGSTQQTILTAVDSNVEFFLWIKDERLLIYATNTSGVLTFALQPTQLLRDISAWYNIVVAIDTTQGTDTNRAKVYINGNQVSDFTTFSSASKYPAQNYDTSINTTNAHTIGIRPSSSMNMDGYLCEFCLIDGSQLDATSFGETDSVTNNWVPKVVTGLTFGTNGFYLPFTNASALGEDFSGNDNDFTANNLTSLDQSVDTCTNNFATANPLYVGLNANFGLSEGNLKGLNSGAGDNNYVNNFGVSSGKWYVEAKATMSGNAYGTIGIVATDSVLQTNGSWLGSTNDSWYYSQNGHIGTNGGSTSTGHATYTTGDIISVALNLDDNELLWYKNGAVQNSGTATSITANKTYFIGGRVYDTSTGWEFNFGSPAYAISSGNVDSSGMGNFEYAVPSGYYSLCTRNLNLIG